MRARLMTIAFWTALAASTAAIPYIPPPQPVYEAPIDRALANVAAMEDLAPAQRARLLGRLNLLAFARDDANFTYLREDDRFNEPGSLPCSEAPRGHRREETPRTFAPGEQCARIDYAVGPRLELPRTAPATPGAGAVARLEAARAQYARAVELEGGDLRARLGYAYALDRLDRSGDARRQLNCILRIGLPQVAGPTSQWETHAVLSEAAAHLAHLARSASERQRMARLRERLQASRPLVYVTPIVVPLADRPFERLADDASSVAFDFAGTGDRRAQGWLTPEAAWLVWDPEWRGEVRSGFDMIGQRAWSVFWTDGFEALRALDDNRDGELAGAELGGLSLWRDENGNGVSDPGEVLPANVHGIAALSVRGRATRPGLITAPAGVRFEDGRTRPLYDWTPGQQHAPIS
jgi:hypothetical protein